jgi:hypothetical protein
VYSSNAVVTTVAVDLANVNKFFTNDEVWDLAELLDLHAMTWKDESFFPAEFLIAAREHVAEYNL